MREGLFISKNKERWDSYLENTDDPDELAKRFVYLVDDLGYAKTHYPNSNTIKYINSLAANIYIAIYKKKKANNNKFKNFILIDLPIIMYRNRKTLLYTFLFFLVFMLIGVFSSWQDQTFVRAVLGDGYVDMTIDNISSGDPFKVYKDQDPFMMFLSITFNNVGVTFKMFLAGIFFSIGTIYLLFKNSLMLGVFEQMFFAHNLGFKSILVVFTHGTLEISGLILAATAGLILGNSFLFPGTYTRTESFTKGARDGAKIIIGLIPVFITAGFFESYLTRHTEMPIILNLFILIGSLAFILFYFVIFPKRVAKKMGLDKIQLP
ncbi:MAG TPA: stage II sporulation protein M [Edaphocola sp.]|nr:stage II sporulation protein M [Edaphocola sp.]